MNNSKYLEITNFCHNYKRPFSVLDIHASESDIIFNLANDFDGNFVAAENDPSTDLLKTCKKNNNDKISLLKRPLNLTDLKKISEVHYFDIILALGHFSEPQEEVLGVIMGMCSYGFIDVGPTIVIGTDEKSIKRRWSDGARYNDGEGIIIDTSFERISVRYRHREENRPWHLGLNLRTFLEYDGVYPTHDKILEMIDEMKFVGLVMDIAPHNMILDRDKLILIDQDDQRLEKKYEGMIPDKAGLKNHLRKYLNFDNKPIHEPN